MDTTETDLTDPVRVEATLRRTMAKYNVKALEMYNLAKHVQNIRKSPRSSANSRLKDQIYIDSLIAMVEKRISSD